MQGLCSTTHCRTLRVQIAGATPPRKINPHDFAWGFILAHPADSLGNKYCLCGIPDVSHGAGLVLNYSLSNAARSNRGGHAPTQNKSPRLCVGLYFGAPGAIRTRNPRLRRAMLYPVKPRVLGLFRKIICAFYWKINI